MLEAIVGGALLWLSGSVVGALVIGKGIRISTERDGRG